MKVLLSKDFLFYLRKIHSLAIYNAI